MFPYVIRSQIEQISYEKNITQKAELRTNSSLEKTEVLVAPGSRDMQQQNIEPGNPRIPYPDEYAL